MYFVESGIAIERDPQISTSSYTMFAETVELLKYEPTSVINDLNHHHLCIIARPQSAGFSGLLLPFFHTLVGLYLKNRFSLSLSLSGM